MTGAMIHLPVKQSAGTKDRTSFYALDHVRTAVLGGVTSFLSRQFHASGGTFVRGRRELCALTNGHDGGSDESLVVTGVLDWRCNGHFPISQFIRR